MENTFVHKNDISCYFNPFRAKEESRQLQECSD